MDTSLFLDDMELVIGLLMKAQSEYAEQFGDDSLFLGDKIVEAIEILQAKLEKSPPVILGEVQRGKVKVFGTDQNGRAIYYLEED